MLPPGHLATGYLTTKLALKALSPWFPQADATRFWVLGMAAALWPDVDQLYFFYRIKSVRVGTQNGINHRKFVWHAPLLHLAFALVGFLTALLARSSDWMLLSIMYAVGTWTHFFFDSFFYGIMWLWPLSDKVYAFRNAARELTLGDGKALQQWINFFRSAEYKYMFALESFAVLVALIIHYRIL